MLPIESAGGYDDNIIAKESTKAKQHSGKNQPFDFPRSKARGLLRVDTERRF